MPSVHWRRAEGLWVRVCAETVCGEGLCLRAEGTPGMGVAGTRE